MVLADILSKGYLCFYSFLKDVNWIDIYNLRNYKRPTFKAISIQSTNFCDILCHLFCCTLVEDVQVIK